MANSKTFATGEMLTATDVNRHLVNAVPTTGNPVTTSGELATNSAHWGNSVVRYRRQGLVVDVFGAITKQTLTSTIGAEVSILAPGSIPVDCRPPERRWTTGIMTIGGTSQRLYRVELTADGAVTVLITNESGSLPANGILRFSATWLMTP